MRFYQHARHIDLKLFEGRLFLWVSPTCSVAVPQEPVQCNLSCLFSWSECIFFPLQLFQSCKANCHETLMKVSQEHIHPTDFFKSLVSILMHPKVFLAGPIASVASAAPGTTEDPRNWTVEPFQISWCVWASLKIGHPPYPALFHNFPPLKLHLGLFPHFQRDSFQRQGQPGAAWASSSVYSISLRGWQDLCDFLINWISMIFNSSLTCIDPWTGTLIINLLLIA